MLSERYVALGYAQITSLSFATAFTVPAGADFAIIAVETASVRWRADGIAPTASIGMPMAPTDSPIQFSGPLAGLKFIAVSGSPVLNVSFFKTSG